MSTNRIVPPISAEQADAEPESERIFTPPASYPRRSATIHLVYHGVQVDLCLTDTPAEQIERLVDGLLKRDGWDAPGALVSISPPATTNGKSATKRAPLRPMYNDDGEPICPVHKKPLRDGMYGLHCTARAEGPDANEKGYCKLRFAEA